MSKINAVRLINLNYNNNAIRISDETFHLNGESTLISLRNGGGKSVLVQMITALFVHKRYQNAKDRPFASYFTTNKPTFILVEWKLDQGAGYVLTGMMVRRNQEISEERQDELEMINFIAEYKERCAVDIHHLPVVEKTKRDVTLKSFHVCRQLFETYKRERNIPFFYYDMGNSAQSRQYFDKLLEYQINYKEWETIIKKVNVKESGLSDLFADCRDEKGLVEKWFLDAVESKLNKDKNRIKEFQSIMEKYTGQYKDNQSKIARRDTIRAFGQEAEGIMESASRCREISERLEEQKGRIADFIVRLHALEEKEKENAGAMTQRIGELEEQLGHLEYEKLSGEIHEILDRERLAGSNLEMMRVEEEAMEREREEISRKIHIYACAKQQERVTEYEEERNKEFQRLLLFREKEENLAPERERLGSWLKEYYEKLSGEKEKERDRCNDSLRQMEEEKTEAAGKLEELRVQEGKLAEAAGGLRAEIKGFDGVEDGFNREYGGKWNRNILGEYEAGALQIGQAEYEKEFSGKEHAKAKARKEAEQYREQRKGMQRLLEDMAAKKIRLESAKKETEQLLAEYGRELEERKRILPYFGMEPEDIFDSEKILAAAERKLADTDLMRQELEKESDRLEKEYRRMAQGQVLELSEEFRNMLEEAGIYFVYGMEWLRKNKYSAARNKRLVKAHPFLPYSLILSKQELEKLAKLGEQAYTSFPVPIILREELEQKEEEQKGAVCSFANLNFYIWFNDNLLEEEKLQMMLKEQDARIRKLQVSVERKKTEYAEYIARQERIRSQKVSPGLYETAKEDIERQRQELSALEQKLLEKREEMEGLEKLQAQREQQIGELEREILYQERRLKDFRRLCENYGQYRESCRLLEKNRKERERVLNLQKLEKEKISRLEQALLTGRNSLAVLEKELEKCAKKKVSYQQYGRIAKETGFSGREKQSEEKSSLPLAEQEKMESGKLLSAEWAREWENRYEVITSGVSAEQKELEERAETAEKRLARALEELELVKEKYRLAKEEWKEVCYDRKEEAHQEILLEDRERKLDRQRKRMHEAEIRCAVLEKERESIVSRMKERCGKEEPVAKADIQTIDFTEAIRKLEYEKGETEKEEERIQIKIRSYENNLTALAEYEEFTCRDSVEWEADFSVMTGAELTKQKGTLIRDYNFFTERQREARLDLERVLNRLLRKELFAEDFYRKPLEAMLQLAGDAERVIRQLETTLASYQSLMEKLLVDISFVEKEKAKIVELVGDYLKEVHDNLNKIDRNSTITVREKPVKMLKIELPDWTENESLYELRLNDYIDDITARGIGLLEENRNVQEYLGTKVTTKELYDKVVGIGNVQIRLYKIEEQREYPITWTDVAKNSGGEGFLSAFVVLSALLYYMRKDDSDIFADRNEGKVLLMDNPFAQTNASHLLKPLMDMAKKANTQLICLSGLGGESIYNRFDNIYVLTLIAANLRSDMQYLKAEHMRGSEEETMLLSRIEVVEQQELVF